MPSRTWVALFRGINVGGHHILPMAELRDELEALGCTEVRTYIQSGNVVFQASGAREDLGKGIEERVEERYGFRPAILLLSAMELQEIAAANPFPQAVEAPKTLHVHFLATPAAEADREGMDQWASDTEAYRLTDHALYLHAPEGIGRSKFAARVDRLLGGAVATGRNWRTVSKLLSMVDAAQDEGQG